MTSPPTTAFCHCANEKKYLQASDMDLKNINLHLDGVTRTFAEWTDDFVNKFYPELGQRSYRVPALHFNQQQLVSRKTFDGLELHTPDAAHAQGDLAHTLVLETFEHLSHALEQEGEPLFIISTLDYDNYLARVKAPPSQKGKENRPKVPKDTKETKKDSGDANILINTQHKGKTQGKDAKHDLIDPQDKSLNNEGGFKLNNHLEDKLLPQVRDSEYAQKERLATVNIDSAQTEQIVNVGKSLLCAAAKYDTEELEKLQGTAEKALTCSWEKEQLVENQNGESQPAVVKPKAKKQKKKKKKVVAEDTTEVESSVLETMNMNCNTMEAEMQQITKGTMVGKRLPPTPRDITDDGLRGDIDVMLLHKQRGIILVEVKATGHPGWCHTDEQIRDRVLKAAQQVKRGCDVFHFIMPDLSCVPCVTLVVAFPYLTKQQLDQASLPLPSDPDILFLCKDDMINFSEVLSESRTTSMAGRDHREEVAADQLAILTWWNNSLVTAMRGSPLSVEDMKTIVGRTCGLLSVVSVWTKTKPRVEIRTPDQAISQVGDRFSHIVLLPKQASLLAHPSPSHLVLTGPMGSGKTLMLQLKGRQWVQEGKRVVVLNVRSTGRGRPIGHVLEEAIRSGESADNTSGSVERLDLATKEFNLQVFHRDLERQGSTDNLCFVLDELTHHTFFLLEQLTQKYPNCCIWCVAMFVRELPVGFQHFRLGAVLRSPPSVQLLLKELDLNPVHNDAYSIRSAARGLPCDGPPVIFIQHKQHSMDTRPHDCVHCADELVDVLQNTLGLMFSNQQEAAPTQPGIPQKAGKPRAQPKAVPAKSLSFRDIIFLVSVPLGYYKLQKNGLWLSEIRDVLKFCGYVQSCPFMTRLQEHGVPMKIIIDNTKREIALPSTDEIVVTDVMGVQSLERKVVFYLPGGPVLDSSPIKTGSSDGNQQSSKPELDSTAIRTGSFNDNQESLHSTPAVALEKSVTSTDLIVQSGPCDEHIASQETVSASQTEHTEDMKAKSTQTNTVTQNNLLDVSSSNIVCSASTENKNTNPVSSSTDFILHATNKATSDSWSPHIKQSSAVSEIILGNMMVVHAQSAAELNPTKVTPPQGNTAEGDTITQTIKPRMGMDLRGDSPLLQSALSPAADRNTLDPVMSLERTEFMKASESVDLFSAQSVFLVPDVQQEESRKQSELHRIREAIASLSMDDQDWLFMAAARCLSQLIVVIP